jgi:hypothetical protein
MGECPDWFWPLEELRTVAKHMRCSVSQAMRLPADDFQKALIAGTAINIARPIIIEQNAKKRA